MLDCNWFSKGIYMSISPLILMFAPLLTNGGKRQVFNSFEQNVKSNLILEKTKPDIQSLYSGTKADHRFARVLVPYKLDTFPSSYYESFYITGEDKDDCTVYNLMPTSSILGFDVEHVGDAEATLKTKLIKSTAEALFKASRANVAISTVNSSEEPLETIDDAIKYLPYSKFSLIRNLFIPDFHNYLDKLNKNDTHALDHGEYIELAGGPYPFGLTTYPMHIYDNANNPYRDFQDAVGTVVEKILSLK